MEIKIEVNNCEDCPFLKCGNRYVFCKKRHKDDVEAYHSGFYAEYNSEIKYLFDHCPFKEHSLTSVEPDTTGVQQVSADGGAG